MILVCLFEGVELLRFPLCVAGIGAGAHFYDFYQKIGGLGPYLRARSVTA